MRGVEVRAPGKKWLNTDKKIELSLTVPITNSLAFLFTVLGDWYVERKVISRGMFFVFASYIKMRPDFDEQQIHGSEWLSP